MMVPIVSRREDKADVPNGFFPKTVDPHLGEFATDALVQLASMFGLRGGSIVHVEAV